MTIALISHQDCLKHDMGSYHPETCARLNAIEDRLISSGLDILLRRYDAPMASREQLLRVHDESYVDSIFRQSPTDGRVWIDGGDTALNPHSLNAALRAAGAVINGVDLVQQGEASAAFCCVRPPGHHAERRQAMGFCIFNNIAIGAAHAMQTYNLSRIAIIDFDVHHGNGTEDIFRDDPRVLFCSSFQYPFYPNMGADTISDHIINLPLPAGTSGKEFKTVAETRWLSAIDQFRPELIMISAGFDGHAEDNMAHFNLVESDFHWITERLRGIAQRHCQGHLVSTLEGGYNLSALGRSVTAHINAMLGAT